MEDNEGPEGPGEGRDDHDAQIEQQEDEIENLKGQVEIYDRELREIHNRAKPEQVTPEYADKLEPAREDAQRQIEEKLDELEQLKEERQHKEIKDIELR